MRHLSGRLPMEPQGASDDRRGVRGAGWARQSGARLAGRNAAGRVPGLVSRISSPARQAFRAAAECRDCDGEQWRPEIYADAKKTLRRSGPGGRRTRTLGSGDTRPATCLDPKLDGGEPGALARLA